MPHQSGYKLSLNNLMFDLADQNTSYRRTHNGNATAPTNKRLLHSTSKYLRRALRNRLRQYVEQGGEIPYQKTR